MTDDDLIADALKQRPLTAREEIALGRVRDFVDDQAFAVARRRVRIAVELLVAAAVATLAITLFIALARHSGPTSTTAAPPHAPTPPPILTKPTVVTPPTPTPVPGGTCPEGQPLNPLSNLLSGVQALGPQHVWVVGEGRILDSHDGGADWRLEYTGPEQFTSVDAIDDNHAWTVGIDALFRTSDGGRTWTRVGEPFSPLASVHFVDAETGYGVITSTCRLVVTADGGMSWQPMDTAPAGDTSVCFTNGRSGWVGADGQVWRTRDGGATWRSVLDTRNQQLISVGELTVQCAAPAGVAVEAGGYGGAAGSSPNAAWVASDGDHFTQAWVSGIWPGSERYPAGPGTYPGPFSIVTALRTVWIGNTPAGYPYGATLIETNGASAPGPPTQVTCEGTAVGAAFITATHGWTLCASNEVDILVTGDAGHTWSVQYRAAR